MGTATSSAPVTIQSHPLVRLEPTVAGDWILSRDDRLHGHRVPASAAAAVVASFHATTREALVSDISALAVDVVNVAQVVDWLLNQNYLVDPRGDETVATSDWLQRWNKNGWRAASKYHARTFGYPFEFYDTAGNSTEDARRMVGYNRQAPDRERAKQKYVGARLSYTVPEPAAELNTFSSDAVGTPGASTTKDLNHVNLLNLLSLVACPVGFATMPYPEAAPVLRKSSPSGGSRHPTELYVVTSGVDGIEDATFHVAATEHTMDSIDTVPIAPSEWVDLLGATTSVSPQNGWALLVYSSMFQRNRYRYREPRTFRTVHMDVGHLMTTSAYIGRSNGWRAEQIQRVDGTAVASVLGLDKYTECPMAATLLSFDGRA